MNLKTGGVDLYFLSLPSAETVSQFFSRVPSRNFHGIRVNPVFSEKVYAAQTITCQAKCLMAD